MGCKYCSKHLIWARRECSSCSIEDRVERIVSRFHEVWRPLHVLQYGKCSVGCASLCLCRRMA